MWKQIENESELKEFMEIIDFFHDSCIKESKYVSGAFVSDDLFMHPLNDCRRLSLLFQRQSSIYSTIELEFSGLEYIFLSPIKEIHSCEIQEATMYFEKNYIVWCDTFVEGKIDLNCFNGTILCAKAVRWRELDNALGNKSFY